MTKTIRRPDTTVILSDIAQRLRKVEQQASGTSIAGGEAATDPKYNSVTIGGVPVYGPASPPTGLTLTTGSFYDDIFVDAKWTAPTDASATDYDIDIAKKNADGTYQLSATYRSGSTSIRISALQANTTYGVRVYGVNRIGVRSSSLPAANAYQDITSAVDATVPPAVSNVTVSRGATSAVIKFTPLTAAQAPDVANGQGQYHIQIHSNSTFTALLQEKYTNDQITAFNDITSEQTVFARVRAIDFSGNAGPWTNASAGAAVGGVNDSMILAGLSAAKITVGEMDASRITAGTMDVNRLKSSALTTQTIDLAGGQFRVIQADVTRLLINSQGLSLYDGGGVRRVFLDTATGHGTFHGDIVGSTITGTTVTGGVVRTAASGRRIELNPTNFGAAIGISSGVIEETGIGVIEAGSGPGFSQIVTKAPRRGAGQFGQIIVNGLDHNDFTTASIVELVAVDGFNLGYRSHMYLASGEVGIYSGGKIFIDSVHDIIYDAGGDHFFFGGEVNSIHPTQLGTTWAFRAQSNHELSSGYWSFAPVTLGGAGGNPATWKVYGPGGQAWEARIGDDTAFADIKASGFIQISTERSKLNIRSTAIKGSDKVKGIRIVDFNRRPINMLDREGNSLGPSDAPHIRANEDRNQLGWVAEEVYAVMPEAVILDDTNTPQGLDLSHMLACVWKANQELEERVALLEGRTP